MSKKKPCHPSASNNNSLRNKEDLKTYPKTIDPSLDEVERLRRFSKEIGLS